jgi:hypothetical protein
MLSDPDFEVELDGAKVTVSVQELLGVIDPQVPA